MAKNTTGGLEHTTPDFTIKQDANEAKAAQKKIESLKEKEADLVKELAELRKEMSVQSAVARSVSSEPGFSNAKPVKGEAKVEAPAPAAKK